MPKLQSSSMGPVGVIKFWTSPLMDLHHHTNSPSALITWQLPPPCHSLKKQDGRDPFPQISRMTDKCFVHFFKLRPTGLILTWLIRSVETFVCKLSLNQCMAVQGNMPVQKPHQHNLKPNLQKSKPWHEQNASQWISDQLNWPFAVILTALCTQAKFCTASQCKYTASIACLLKGKRLDLFALVVWHHCTRQVT